MKSKRIILIVVVVFIFLCNSLIVSAHPGRTDKKGGHTCRTNCQKYGLSYGEYHYHNEGSSVSNSSNGISSSTVPIIPVIKSSNNALSYLKVDNKLIKVSSSMEYMTTNPNPSIIVVPQSSKATYEIIGNNSLNDGDNTISIKIRAENLNIKTYLLNIYVISTDASLSMIRINDENIAIEDIIYFNTVLDTLDIYALSNSSKAIIEYPKNVKLNLGDNIISLKVTAEDKLTKKDYQLKVFRREKSSEVGLTIYINDMVLDFNKNIVSNDITFNNNVKNVEILSELIDSNAKINIINNVDLKVGKNKIPIEVIAENGLRQEYVLNIFREPNLIIILVIPFVFIIVTITLIIKKKRYKSK